MCIWYLDNKYWLIIPMASNKAIYFRCNILIFPPKPFPQIQSLTKVSGSTTVKLSRTRNAHVNVMTKVRTWVSPLHRQWDCNVLALHSPTNPSNTLNLSSAPPLCPWGGSELRSHPPATEVEDSAIVKHSPGDRCSETIIKGNFSCSLPLCEVFTQAYLKHFQ